MIDPPLSSPALSDKGLARREAILVVAVRAAQRRRRQQRLRSGVAAGVLCVVLISAALLALRPGRVDLAGPHSPPTGRGTTPAPPQPLSPVAGVRPNARPAAVTIGRVRTEAGIAARLAVRSSAPRGRATPLPLPRASDEELLASLAKAGRPAGLAYVDDRAVLLFRDSIRRQ